MVFELTRREFLLVNAAVGLTALGPSLFAADRSLSTDERAALLVVARTIFRHDHVGDGVYAKAVAAIEDHCQADPEIGAIVADGIARLQQACLGTLARAGREKCVALLAAMKGSAFYRVVYREALEAVYGSAEAWGMFRRASKA